MAKTTKAAKAEETMNEATEAAELSPEERLAALEAENAALRDLTTEQSEKLALHEQIADEVVVNVKGKVGYVAANMRTADGILTRKQIAADKALCEHLVDIGSHIIRFK